MVCIISSMVASRSKLIENRNFGFNENQVMTYAFKLYTDGSYKDVTEVLSKLNDKYTVLFNRNLEDTIDDISAQAIIFSKNTQGLNLHLCQGEFLTPNDSSSVVIGKNLYDKLGSPKTISLGSRTFKVKGVLDRSYLNLIMFTHLGLNDYFCENKSFYKEYLTIKVIKKDSKLTDEDKSFISSTLQGTPNLLMCHEFSAASGKSTLSAAMFEMKDKVDLNSLVCIAAAFNIIVVSTFWIKDRRKEIAIRKAFGATNSNIKILIYKELGTMMAFSLVISFALQFILVDVLSYLFKIDISFSWLYITAVFIVAFILVFLASFVPIRKALHMEISSCLKE